MEYRIIRKDAFCFAGISRRVPMQFTGINSAISELERSITKEQWAGLRRLQDTEPREIVNVSYDSDTGFMEERGFLTHMIGVLTEHDDIDSQFDKLQMPASAHATICFGTRIYIRRETHISEDPLEAAHPHRGIGYQSVTIVTNDN